MVLSGQIARVILEGTDQNSDRCGRVELPESSYLSGEGRCQGKGTWYAGGKGYMIAP